MFYLDIGNIFYIVKLFNVIFNIILKKEVYLYNI